MKLKKLILLLFILTGNCFIASSATFYIDPQFRGEPKGSFQNPFNAWEQISWANGNTYLFKRGSTYETDKTFHPTADNIIISAYGEGKNPVIISSLGASGRIFDFGGLKNIQLKNFEIISKNGAETCVHFFKSANGSIVNCKVSGSQWGIRNALSNGTFLIKDCEILKTADDGIFILDVDSVLIEETHVYDVNLNYFINKQESYSGGDCIQLVNVKFFHIKNNILDHSSTGNKFCLISSSTNEQIIPTGIVEGNKFIRNPISDDGDLLYLTESDNVFIHNNSFFYGDHAIYNHSINIKVIKNLFVKQHQIAVYDEPKHVAHNLFQNNTFSQIPKGIESHAESTIAVNNIFFEISAASFSGKALIMSKNNCFFPEEKLSLNTSDSASFVADPLFVNYLQDNYKLKQGSPCIGKSINLENNKKSFSMNSLPENIGAF